MYLVVVLDWYTKKVVGHYAGLQANTQHWLAAARPGGVAPVPAGEPRPGRLFDPNTPIGRQNALALQYLFIDFIMD
jgi:hypothetical protein